MVVTHKSGIVKLTITTHLQIDDTADPHIDDAEKPLILLLELLLVENLDREDAVLTDSPVAITNHRVNIQPPRFPV